MNDEHQTLEQKIKDIQQQLSLPLPKELQNIRIRIQEEENRDCQGLTGMEKIRERKVKELRAEEEKIIRQTGEEKSKLNQRLAQLLSLRDSIIQRPSEEEERARMEEEENAAAEKAEQQKEQQKKKPINLRRYVNYYSHIAITWRTWKLLWLAEKRERRLLVQICRIANLRIVRSSELSPYFQNKHRTRRLTELGRGYYLLPNPKKPE